MRILRLAVAILLVSALVSATITAQAADPFAGTWKLNLTKSRFPGPPPEQSYLLTFETQRDGTTLGIVYDLDDRGMRTAVSRLTFRYDGKAYPDVDIATGMPKENALAFTRIDARTVEVVHTLGPGRGGYREIRRVAEDGRSLTFSASALRGGQTVTVLQVFDRQ